MMWAYLAGLATLPAGWAFLAFLWWSFNRGTGSEGCLVCDNIPHWEIGQRFNITCWLIFRWHTVWWSFRRWHKDKMVEFMERY